MAFIRMFYDNKEHHIPHIHIEYAEFAAVIEIPSGRLLAGDFPKDKLKLVLAWIEIHKEELEEIGNSQLKEKPYLKLKH